MASNESRSTSSGAPGGPAGSLSQRLERGEIAYYPIASFETIHECDREFLLQQRVVANSGRHVEFEPETGSLDHLAAGDAAARQRVRTILGDFASRARSWL